MGLASSTTTGRFETRPNIRKDIAILWSRAVLTVQPPAIWEVPVTTNSSALSLTFIPEAVSP